MKLKINGLLARAFAALCCLAPPALWAQMNPAAEDGEAQRAAAFRTQADAAYAAKDVETGNRHLRGLIDSCPGRWDLARPALATILRMSTPGPDNWREYAALRLIAAGRANQILPADPCLRDAWETLIVVRQRQGRLLEADAACEALGEAFGKDVGWELLKARLCYQANAYETGARFAGLLAAVSRDDNDPLASTVWYAMQPYLEGRDRALQAIVAAYESGRLLPSSPPREMLFKNCSAEWQAVRKPLAEASPQRVHSLIQESLQPLRLIPEESTATITWLWNLIDRHLLSQTPEALLPLRRLQEDDLRNRLDAARVTQAYSGDPVERFRRHPWADGALRELLEYGRKELSRGHAGVALRSFRDVLSHVSNSALRAEAQVCLWLALAQQDSREEFAAAFRDIDPEKRYPWMGGTEPAQAIRRRLEEDLTAAPARPPDPRLRDMARRVIRVPSGDFAPASGAPPSARGDSGSSLTGESPMRPPSLTKVGVQFHGDAFLVSSPNLMAWYRAADPGVPVWQRTARFPAPEFGQLPGLYCPAAAGGRLYLRWGHDDYPADIAAVDIQTGGQVWSTAQDDAWRSQERGSMNRWTWPVNDPVIADGRLYLLAVQRADGNTGEMHLQCLEPDTGTMIWKSLIADEPFRGAEGWDLERRGRNPALYGNAVTPHQGAVYCAANVGIVARCDARDGYLEWAHRYPRTRYLRRETAAREPGEQGDPFAWGMQPLVVGRRAIFMPRDYDGVFALDTDTGGLLWQNAFIQPAGAIGTFEGTLLVYDRRTLAALDLKTGSARWFRRFEEGLLGSGQLIGSSLYVGTPHDLCRIHAGSGTVIERIAWGGEGRMARDFAIHEGVLYLVSDEPAPADNRRSAASGSGRPQRPAGGPSVKLYRRLEPITADGSRQEWSRDEYAELPLDDTDKDRGSLWLAQDGRNLHLAIAYKDSRVAPLCGDGGYSDGDWVLIDVQGPGFRSRWKIGLDVRRRTICRRAPETSRQTAAPAVGIGHELKTFQHIDELTVPLGIFRSWVKGVVTVEVWDHGGGKGAEKILARTATTIGLHPLSRAEETADLAIIRDLPDLSESRILYRRLQKFYTAWPDELPPYPVSKAPAAPAREVELLTQYVSAAGGRRFPYPFYRSLARLGGVDALPRDVREWFRRRGGLEATVQGPYELNDSLFVTNWLVLGYFPCAGDGSGIDSDYLQSAGGEPRHLPDRDVEIATGGGLRARWVPYASPRSEIDFFSMKRFGLEDKWSNAVVYAACWLKADKDTACELRVDTMDDAYKVYLDHEILEESRAIWEAAMREATCEPITLTKGLHMLLMKVDGNVLPPGANNVYQGLFGFRLRVTDASGGRPEGITVWN